MPTAHFPEVDKLMSIITEDVALRRVTAYRSPTFTIKATRQRRYDGRSKAETILVTFGVPNYEERYFIKDALAAGEPFPIKKVQLRYWPKKKLVRRKHR